MIGFTQFAGHRADQGATIASAQLSDYYVPGSQRLRQCREGEGLWSSIHCEVHARPVIDRDTKTFGQSAAVEKTIDGRHVRVDELRKELSVGVDGVAYDIGRYAAPHGVPSVRSSSVSLCTEEILAATQAL